VSRSAWTRATNLLNQDNRVAVSSGNQFGGPVSQSFQYDDLYRLTKAEGQFEYRQGRFHTYTMDMKYDNIHNIEQKTQVHNIEGGNKVQAQRGTSYDWTYDYAGNAPHAPTHIGERSFSYDANGNQTGWKHDSKGTRRNILWDDENRVMEIQDPSNTLRFKYDAGGQRIIKEGQQGRTVYVNQYYVVKNGATVSKHIFAGTTRLATALIHGQKPQRVSGSNDTGTTSPYSGTDANTSTSQKGKGKQDKPNKGKATGPQTTAASDNADTHAGKSGKSHPGKGNEHRSDRANEVAQNTLKNPNLNGQGQPGQGINKRSDKAKERSRNLEQNPHAQANETPQDPWVSDTGSLKISKFMYFYHPDHLGSTSYVTDGDGALIEHVAYFAFGESWVTEARNGNNIDYLFTSKEMDSETGLYYFGARYYDPRTSVWQSADPILDQYLPSGNQEADANLPGMGGVFRPINVNLYRYAGLNPLILNDPTGQSDSPHSLKSILEGGISFELSVRKGSKRLGIGGGKVWAAREYDSATGKYTQSETSLYGFVGYTDKSKKDATIGFAGGQQKSWEYKPPKCIDMNCAHTMDFESYNDSAEKSAQWESMFSGDISFDPQAKKDVSKKRDAVGITLKLGPLKFEPSVIPYDPKIDGGGSLDPEENGA